MLFCLNIKEYRETSSKVVVRIDVRGEVVTIVGRKKSMKLELERRL